MSTIFTFLNQKEILIILITGYIICLSLGCICLRRDIDKERSYNELMERLHKGRPINLIDIIMNSFFVFFMCVGALTLIFLFQQNNIENFWLMLVYSIITLIPLFTYSIFLCIRIIKIKIFNIKNEID